MMMRSATNANCRPGAGTPVDGVQAEARAELNPASQPYPQDGSRASAESLHHAALPERACGLSRFQTALAAWPSTGTGQRLVHRHVARLARLAQLAGIPAAQAAAAIDAAMRYCTRSPQAGEIEDALRFVGGCGGTEWAGGGRAQVIQPVAFDTFGSFAKAGVAIGFSESDLRNPTPARMPGSEDALRITWEPGWQDAILFLLALFEPEDWVLCLPRKDVRAGESDVRPRDAWCTELERRGRANEPLPALVGPNPVKAPGHWALNKSGCPSPRVKGSVAVYRNLVLDRDLNPLNNRNLAVATQVAFLGGWGQRFGWGRVRSVVHSGNKSLHTVLRVDARDAAGWDSGVAHGILAEFVRMGFDGSFANPAQMCRLPGAWRRLEDNQLEAGDMVGDGTVPEANRWKPQRLLYVKVG